MEPARARQLSGWRGRKRVSRRQAQGIALGGNRYRYDWSLPFEETDIGKSFNYTISYKHSSLAAEMRLAEKSIDVKAISINFGDATVAPIKGKWNDTYAYSVPVSSSVEMKVALEVYNPCSREWVERASGTATSWREPCQSDGQALQVQMRRGRRKTG